MGYPRSHQPTLAGRRSAASHVQAESPSTLYTVRPRLYRNGTDTARMITHDLIDFCALVASGVIGALIATPVRQAVVIAVRRTRSDRRR